MKKFLRTIILIFISFFAITIFQSAQANYMENLSMDVYIKSNGDADIKEVWKCRNNEGTEAYHPYYNLGKSKITNLSVVDGDKKYTTVSSWDVSETLENKAYKCGLNKVKNGVEICWGISKYGEHEYEVNYTITNFVSKLKDAQMAYWTLIPNGFSTSIAGASIKIHSDFQMSKNNVDVWVYGNYLAKTNFEDGVLFINPNNIIRQGDKIVVLLNFPEGTFDASNKLNHKFNYYYKKMDRASRGLEGMGVFYFIFNTIFAMGMLTVVLCFVYAYKCSKSLKFGKSGRNIPEEVDYCRDIPFDGDLIKAYTVAYYYNLIDKKTNIIGAFLLKWIKDGKLSIEGNDENKISIRFNETDKNLDNVIERKMFSMLLNASLNNVLEEGELINWCKVNNIDIAIWFQKIIRGGINSLISEGLIKEERKRVLGIKFFEYREYLFQPELKEIAIKLAGLKKYIKDYTLIKDRNAKEVQLLEEYLIYAQMFGIAEKVSDEFKKISLPENVYNYLEKLYKLSFETSITSINSNVSISYYEPSISRYSSYSYGRRQ